VENPEWLVAQGHKKANSGEEIPALLLGILEPWSCSFVTSREINMLSGKTVNGRM
jgi:hypothetical protein